MIEYNYTDSEFESILETLLIDTIDLNSEKNFKRKIVIKEEANICHKEARIKRINIVRNRVKYGQINYSRYFVKKSKKNYTQLCNNRSSKGQFIKYLLDYITFEQISNIK